MSYVRITALLSLILLTSFPLLLDAQSQQIADWTFHPNYTLPRNAANYPGNKVDPPQGRFDRFKRLGGPVVFQGQNPTQRISDLLERTKLPTSAFTLELFLLNHVNQPVGVLLTTGSIAGPKWYLGYYDDELSFYLQDENDDEALIETSLKKGWKNYWLHVVAYLRRKRFSCM